MASNAVNTSGEAARRDEAGEGSSSGSGITVANREGVDESLRIEAGPLPSKRGEIGYDESTSQTSTALTPTSDTAALPERHPADRDDPPEATPPRSDSLNPPSPSDASSTRSSGSSSLVKYLRPKKLPKVGGIRLSTIGFLVAQSLLLTGTIIAWVFAIKRLPAALSPQDGSGTVGSNTTAIFIHVTFAIAVLMQLVFGERTLFRARAERYAFKHPGEILPSSRRGQSSGAVPFSLAPWNRPPLPTYAAALAQNGLGTGDVEDNIIAVPPPPAYGNTRGSTLLLAGFIGDTLRAQRVRERVRDSHGSQMTIRSSWRSEISLRPDRPVSYRSHDSAWEETMDANRAMHLEETLARLEDGPDAARRSPSRMGGTR